MKTKATIDPALQAQVDAQLMERGAFSALELLLDTGRLDYGDYERWRQREVEYLDSLLMGSRQKIQLQMQQAAEYARTIGLVEESQEFHAWPASATAPAGVGVPPAAARAEAGSQVQAIDVATMSYGRTLRISADAELHRLIAGRYTPAQNAPQMDLFSDNPVVALTNGIAQALSVRNLAESQRLLDRLYEHAPDHADLGSYDRLVSTLAHAGSTGSTTDDGRSLAEASRDLESLLEIVPMARRLLGSHAMGLLAPLWRQLADSLATHAFDPDKPNLHRSFALLQAQDWSGLANVVREEPSWSQHPALCLRLAQSAFHRHRRAEALQAWCHVCWRAPDLATDILDRNKQPDVELAELWQTFRDSDDESTASLTAADFPAWLLLNDIELTQHLPIDLPTADTPAEETFRCAHRWAQARRARRSEELNLRKELHSRHPALFQYLKRSLEQSR